MAKFQFRLAPLLTHRRKLEDVAQRDLAKTLRQQMVLQNQIRCEQEMITQSKRQLADALVGCVDVDRVSHFARYSGQVSQRTQGIVLRLATIESEIKQGREKLAEAMRQRKVIELLRQRYYEAWKRRQRRVEAAMLDQIVMYAGHTHEVTGAGI